MNIFRTVFKARHILSVAAISMLVIASACSNGDRQYTMPPGAGIHSWYENGAGGHYVAPIIAGSGQILASGSRIGTVLTDTNCAPDARGLSHCHNSISFGNGSQITIMDNHQMSHHRCLRPGERVRVSLLAKHWVTLQTGI